MEESPFTNKRKRPGIKKFEKGEIESHSSGIARLLPSGSTTSKKPAGAAPIPRITNNAIKVRT
jgi:hypothetical protein